MPALNSQNMGRSMAARWKHRFIYALIYIGGRRLAYGFLYLLVGVYCLYPSVRQKSAAYITRRFAPKTKFEFLKHTYLLNLTFAKTLVDRAALGILGTAQADVSPQDQQTFERLASSGKGFLVLTAHAGCWQMASYLMSRYTSRTVHILYFKNPHDNDQSVAAHRQAQNPYHVIDASDGLGGVVEMMRVLAKGDIVCAMADRVFGNEKNAVTVDFLGGKMRVPYSFYKLSAALQVPVIFLFFPWKGCGKFSLKMFPPFTADSSETRVKKWVFYAQQFAGALEQFCIKYPYQFFNYFNVWES